MDMAAIQALCSALAEQRNAALNALAHLQAELAVLKAQQEKPSEPRPKEKKKYDPLATPGKDFEGKDGFYT